MWVERTYVQFFVVLLKYVVGLTHRVEDKQNLDEALKQGPCLIVCLHQSLWETMIFHVLLPKAAFVSKKELFMIPCFGGYLKRGKSICVDREKGTTAMKTLITKGKEARDHGFSIVLFAQGNRVPFEEKKVTLQRGFIAVYKKLNMTIAPAVLDSGFFWKRRGFVKLPGTITLKFLPPVLPQKDPGEVFEHVEKILNDGLNELQKRHVSR